VEAKEATRAEFLRAAWSRWRETVTGRHSAPYLLAGVLVSIIVAVLSAQLLDNIFVKIAVSCAIPVILIITSTMESVYGLWRDEKSTRLSAQEILSGMRASAEISSVIIGENQGQAACIMNIGIRNIGPPTIANTFNITVTKNGKSYPSRIAAFSNARPIYLRGTQQADAIEITQKDMIYEKTTIPIPMGGLVRGWLTSTVDGIDRVTLQSEGTEIVVEFSDVLRKRHSARYITGKMQTDIASRWYYPGVGGRAIPPSEGEI
jgi:hypothetical protein